MGAINQSKVTGGAPARSQTTGLTRRRYNPLTGRYQMYDVNMGRFVTEQEQQSRQLLSQRGLQLHQANQQRQAAVAAQQKAEKRVTELEKELKGYRDITEGKANMGFRTPLRTVSTAGSMGANLRIGDRGGSRSRRAIRARSRGVSQLSTA